MNGKDFLGRGVKFPIQIDPKTGRIAMVSYEEDIAEAIDIIIGTHRGERVMRQDFGSTASAYMFESVAYAMKDSIAHDLHEQLLLQEPRIVDVRVTASDGSVPGAILIDISYTVRSTNNRYNKVYPFFLNESEENKA
ncbi:MAG: GPW/gp25 family protein [Oscillospiraceae bacterium]|jgi:phage baseplate assembly protein W|nr:GPW/gp25 family protein [Oscillospiraceae bacterium]